MFQWFKPIDSAEGLEEMRSRVGDMLTDGRHIFDAAANAFLGGADPEVIRDNLFATDKRINDLERKVRRQAVVHGSVYGTSQLPTCLVLMSIVKDAERIGDYSKNLFDIAVITQKKRDDPYFDDLLKHKDELSELLAEAMRIYRSQKEDKAKAFLHRGDALQDHYDRQVERLLGPNPGTEQPAATALAYRYYKRIIAHLLNIISSLVVPLDELDYFDEDPATRGPEPDETK
ncbi:MAG: PhoU domain-containing protein [Planctomycetota bacterium]|jgi:phosphate uptake regulator